MELGPSSPKKVRFSNAERLSVDQEQSELQAEARQPKTLLANQDLVRPSSEPIICSNLPNELVYELCCAILALKTSDRILLTSISVHTYLESRFSRKAIYSGALAFVKTRLAERWAKWAIEIDQVAPNSGSEIILVKQTQQGGEFELETNHFRVRMTCKNLSITKSLRFNIWDDNYENTQMHYFLRLIAQLLPPIELHLINVFEYLPIGPIDPDLVNKRFECQAIGHSRFLDAQSGHIIDSVRLADPEFCLDSICTGLAKCDALTVYYGLRQPAAVPNLIRWLTANNNNGRQLKKCIFRDHIKSDVLVALLDEIKKNFICATSKCRFVVGLSITGPLTEFTLCNGRTGETLKLRGQRRERRGFYALSRLTSGDNLNALKCFEFEAHKTKMVLESH